MTRIIKNARASDLPISDIDRNAVVIMHCDEIGHTETTVQIQSGDEYIHIDPTSVSVSLDKSTASDLWKAYYLPMYYQAKWLCSAVGRISRTTSMSGAQVDHSVTITYYAKTDTFNIEYRGNKYILSYGDSKITLECEHPILILESPVFKVDSEATGAIKYAIEEKTIIAINELLLCRPMCDPLLSIMGYFKERAEFLEKYEANAS